jgi:hypothetical protein
VRIVADGHAGNDLKRSRIDYAEGVIVLGEDKQ